MSAYHFDKETLSWLEDALLIGLSEHGECERIRSNLDELESRDKEFDKNLYPMHPTGTSDVIGRFHTALSIVRSARETEDRQASA
jgi:hypothetical protein